MIVDRSLQDKVDLLNRFPIAPMEPESPVKTDSSLVISDFSPWLVSGLFMIVSRVLCSLIVCSLIDSEAAVVDWPKVRSVAILLCCCVVVLLCCCVAVNPANVAVLAGDCIAGKAKTGNTRRSRQSTPGGGNYQTFNHSSGHAYRDTENITVIVRSGESKLYPLSQARWKIQNLSRPRLK